MPVLIEKIQITSKGFCDVIDITREVEAALQKSSLKNGIVTVFVPGSTASITTMEYESGAIEDLKRALEKVAPTNLDYRHNERWGDGNGFAHVRAALLGPSVTIPFSSKRLMCGTWQQIVLVDFDNRSRRREILVQMVGE